MSLRFARNSLVALLTLPSLSYAEITFQEGDVISAEVFNSIISRLNNVQKGFEERMELDGEWACRTYGINPADYYSNNTCTNSDGGMFGYKDGVMSFDGIAGTWSYDGVRSFYVCDALIGSNVINSGEFDVKSGYIALGSRMDKVDRLSSTKFSWAISNSFPQSGFVECELISGPPQPVERVNVTVDGQDIEIDWHDSESTATEYKVQRIESETGAWETVHRTPHSIKNYTEKSLGKGKYRYRVIATNDDGDSSTSSIVEAEVE